MSWLAVAFFQTPVNENNLFLGVEEPTPIQAKMAACGEEQPPLRR